MSLIRKKAKFEGAFIKDDKLPAFMPSYNLMGNGIQVKDPSRHMTLVMDSDWDSARSVLNALEDKTKYDRRKL